MTAVTEMARQFSRRKLQKKRKSLGWTETKLAGELGVTAQTIKNWEAGENEPSLPLFLRLCDVLKVEERELVDVIV